MPRSVCQSGLCFICCISTAQYSALSKLVHMHQSNFQSANCEEKHTDLWQKNLGLGMESSSKNLGVLSLRLLLAGCSSEHTTEVPPQPR